MSFSNGCGVCNMEQGKLNDLNDLVKSISIKSNGGLTDEEREKLKDKIITEFASVLKEPSITKDGKLVPYSPNLAKGTINIDLSGYPKGVVNDILTEIEFALYDRVSFTISRSNPKVLKYEIGAKEPYLLRVIKETLSIPCGFVILFGAFLFILFVLFFIIIALYPVIHYLASLL